MFNSITEAVFHYETTQPDKLCLADDTSSVTYRQYGEKIRKYAGAFAAAGVEKDHKIVVEASQTIEYLAMELAIQLLALTIRYDGVSPSLPKEGLSLP